MPTNSLRWRFRVAGTDRTGGSLATFGGLKVCIVRVGAACQGDSDAYAHKRPATQLTGQSKLVTHLMHTMQTVNAAGPPNSHHKVAAPQGFSRKIGK